MVTNMLQFGYKFQIWEDSHGKPVHSSFHVNPPKFETCNRIWEDSHGKPVHSYKGHPLRRKDNFIYYGTMAEKYIIMLQILSTKNVDGLEMADRVAVQLQLTDPELRGRDRVVKRSEKDSLYAAMDVASVWLDRALSSK